MAPAIEVKTFTIKDLTAKPSPIEELDNPFGYAPTDLQRYGELTSANPLAHQDDPALILVIRSGTIVGRLQLHTSQVHYGGETRTTFSMGAFHVEEEARKTGVGAPVILEARKRCGSLAGAGSPSEGARRLYQAAGLRELPRLQRFLRFFHAGPIAQWYLPQPALAYLAAAGGALPLRLYNAWYTPRTEPTVRIEPVTYFDDRLDRLSPKEPNYFPKPAALLNWIVRFKEVFAFEILRGDSLVGFCLLRCDDLRGGGGHNLPPLKLGVLVDWFIDEASVEDYQVLLRYASRWFSGRKMDAMECEASSKPLIEACRACGMIHKGGHRAFFRPAPKEPFSDEGDWHLTAGIADLLLCGRSRSEPLTAPS